MRATDRFGCPEMADAPGQNDPNGHFRSLVTDHLGPSVRIRHLGPAPVFGGPIFVADFDRRPEHYRLLGSFGPAGTSGSAYSRLIEQSAVDLIVPSRLVSQHEKLMALAFAFCERQATVLLLGIGGVSMWRFIRTHLPECTRTLVDNDADIVSIARRWFHLDQPVSIADGKRFLADTTATFDAILVDLQGADGPVQLSEGFWTRCLHALAPGGCWRPIGQISVPGALDRWLAPRAPKPTVAATIRSSSPRPATATYSNTSQRPRGEAQTRRCLRSHGSSRYATHRPTCAPRSTAARSRILFRRRHDLPTPSSASRPHCFNRRCNRDPRCFGREIRWWIRDAAVCGHAATAEPVARRRDDRDAAPTLIGRICRRLITQRNATRCSS